MIYYDEDKKTFTLKTKDTCYVMGILYSKYLFHYHYGTLTDAICYALPPEVSFSTSPPELDYTGFSLETLMAEYAYYGTGDFRATSLRLRCRNDESTMFCYKEHRIYFADYKQSEIPCAYGKHIPTLDIVLSDEVFGCTLTLRYKVFRDSNVITRSAILRNENATDTVTVENCMSMCLDLYGSDYDVLSLYGSYGNEMNLKRNPLFFGNQRLISRRGATGHIYNPFFAVCDHAADYDSGNVYGLNLIYGGSFLSEIEVSAHSPVGKPYDTVRLQTGVCPENFGYVLCPRETFVAPEAVMTFSSCGINGMTENMHRFVNTAILPHARQKMPIVLNTWEACFYDINEEKLLSFARMCPSLGIDTLAVDDGWFARRNDDASGLGDWKIDRKKFPSGLRVFAEKVSQYVDFGIWIEPEMISKDSDLYRRHPEWVLGKTSRPLSIGRHQYVLDLTRDEVLDYLKDTCCEMLRDVPVRYIKWDMNRHLTEVGSFAHDDDAGGGIAHRYIMGVCKLLHWFRVTFPDVCLETCSGGGGRYNLALAAYSDMIWASDNTYPAERLLTETGALTGYPASMMSCHVSCPSDSEASEREMENRFAVAAMGTLGYELDLHRLPETALATIGSQTQRYKLFRDTVAKGTYRVVRSPHSDGVGAISFIQGDDFVLICAGLRRCASTSTELPFADENAVYTEMLSGETVNGKELKSGAYAGKLLAGGCATVKYFVKESKRTC